MSHPACSPHRVRLAEGSFCTIDSCACGTLHVSIGAVTLRLHPEVAESIWNTLGRGLQALDRERRRDTSIPAGFESFFRPGVNGVRGSG